MMTESQQFYSLLLRAPAAIAIYKGPHLRIDFINPACLSYIGKTDLLGKTFDEAFPELKDTDIRTVHFDVYKTGREFSAKSFPVERDFGKGKNEIKYFDLVLRPSLDSHGDIDGIVTFAFDVSSEVYARMEAEGSEKKFRQLADSLPDIVWSADKNGNIEFCNRRWYELTGLAKPVQNLNQWLHPIHPADLEKSLHSWEQSLLHKVEFEVEQRIRSSKGEYLWYLVRAVPVFNSQGEVTQWIGSSTNIHHQKVGQEKIQSSKEFLDKASAILSSSLDYEETLKSLAKLAVPRMGDWCTISVQETLEREPKEIAVVHWNPERQRNTESYRKNYPANWNDTKGVPQVIRSGKSELYPILTDEALKASAKDKKHFDILKDLDMKSIMIVPLKGSTRVVGAVLFISAESGHYYSEEDLKFAEEFGRRAGVAIENALTLKKEREEVHSLDKSLSNLKTITDFGQSLSSEFDLNRLLQTTLEKVVHLTQAHLGVLLFRGQDENSDALSLDFFSGPTFQEHSKKLTAQLSEKIWKSITPPQALKSPHLCKELINKINDGNSFSYQSCLAVPLLSRSQENLGCLILMHPEADHFSKKEEELCQRLTSQVSLSVENLLLHRKSQEAIRARDEFLSIASHELKNPLTPLKIQIQSLKHFIEKGQLSNLNPEHLKNIANSSDKQIGKLIVLIEDLLDVTRLSSGKFPLNKELFNLTELIYEILERFESQLALAKCQVKVNLHSPLSGYWDRIRLEQAFINLLSNAMKYAPGSSIEITSTLKHDKVLITFYDQGPGISEDDQKRIFNRFERASSGQSASGLGLGLYITRKIVEAHNGSVSVESKPGKGSAFTIELPLSTANATESIALEK